jgi:hypothetical protein
MEVPIIVPELADLFLAHLPGIFRALIGQVPEDPDDEADSPASSVFWKQVTQAYGASSFTALLPTWAETFSSPPSSAQALVDYARGCCLALSLLDAESSGIVIHGFFFPLAVIAAQAPKLCDQVIAMLSHVTVTLSPLCFKPITDFLFAHTSSDPESGFVSRHFLLVLSAIISIRQDTCFTSIDVVFKYYIAPFFANVRAYPLSSNSELLVFFFVLLEAAASPPSAKFDWLIERVEEVVANGDPTERPFQEFLANMFNLSAAASAQSIVALTGLIVRHMEKVLKAVNSTDVITADLVEPSIMALITAPFYGDRPDLAVELIRAILKFYDCFSIPMRQTIMTDVLGMIRVTIPVYPKEMLLMLYESFDELVKKEKNVDVLSPVICILGWILLFSGQLREMSDVEAAAITSVALLFDEVDPLVERAFELLNEKIEVQGPSKTKFWQQIVADFWKRNSEHMLPKVEAALGRYRFLVRRSYFA